MLLTPSQIKPKSFESRWNSFFFLPRVDTPHVYVCALVLGCFNSHINYPNLLEGADHAGGQLRGDKECPFSGITKSGRVWRKVSESDAQSVVVTLCHFMLSHSTVFMHTTVQLGWVQLQPRLAPRLCVSARFPPGGQRLK